VGFATRVAARWAISRRQPNLAGLWERLCWWGAGAATALCLAGVIYRTSLPEPDPFEEFMNAPMEGANLF
jgi:hypothetical protein